MGFFKSLKKLVSKANKLTNSVMKVADPIGGYLKEYTETKSQADLAKMLGLAPPKQSAGGMSFDTRRLAADEATIEKKDEQETLAARQRRQGSGPGSTLLTASGDDNQLLSKSTLLGL